MHQMRIITVLGYNKPSVFLIVFQKGLVANPFRYGSEPPMSNGIICIAESQLPSSCLSITGGAAPMRGHASWKISLPAAGSSFFTVFALLPLQHLSADVPCNSSMLGLTPVYAASNSFSGRLMSLVNLAGS